MPKSTQDISSPQINMPINLIVRDDAGQLFSYVINSETVLLDEFENGLLDKPIHELATEQVVYPGVRSSVDHE